MSISVAAKFNPSSIQQSLLPGQTCAFDLGSTSLQFRNAFLNGFLSFKGSEGGAVERRLQENVGDIQLVDATSTLLRSLNTDILPTTLTPASVATIGTGTSYARGDHIHGMNLFGPGGLDSRYIKRSPSGENQIILPLTNNVPLTIQEFAGGNSDILDLIDTTGATVFTVGSTGTVLVQPTSVGLVGLIIKGASGGGGDIFDVQNSGGAIVLGVTAAGIVDANNRMKVGGLGLASSTFFQLGLASGSDSTETIQAIQFSFTLNAAPGTFNFFNVFGTLNATGVNPGTITGLNFTPTIALSGVTWATIIGLEPAIIHSGTGTITEEDVIAAKYGPPSLGQTITLLRGVWITPFGTTTGTLTTMVGLDIDALPTATTAIGIRQKGTAETNRIGGKTRIATDLAVPTNQLEVGGTTLILPLTNVVPLTLQEPSAGSSDILDIKDSTGVIQAFVNSVGTMNLNQGLIATNSVGGFGSTIITVNMPTSASSVTITGVLLSGTATLNATGASYTGFSDSSTIQTSGAGLTSLAFNSYSLVSSVLLGGQTWTTSANLNVGGVVSGTGTISEYDVILIGPEVQLTPTITLYRGIAINLVSDGTGTITTAVGLDILALPTIAATKLGIRQQGASDLNELAGKTRIGDTGTAPKSNLEVNGGRSFKVKTVTTAYAALITDSVIFADATAAAFTVTLPAAASSGSGVGQRIEVIKSDASANAVTVSRAGADTIQGATSLSLAAQYNKAVLVSDNVSKWYDLGAGLV